MLRNKNVTSTSLMNRTQSIPSLLPFVENRTYNLSPRVEFKPRRRLWYCTNIKKRIRLSDIYGNHSGENYRMRIKSRYGFIHYGLFEASKEKDFKAFSGIPLFCFNKQWLIKQNSLFHTIYSDTIIAALGGY